MTPTPTPRVRGDGSRVRDPHTHESSPPKKIGTVVKQAEHTLEEVFRREALAALRPTVRQLREGDWNFVLHSWMKSYRDERPRWRQYWEEMQREIETYRGRGADFWIACDADDIDSIYGWSCIEEPVLHYVYVKQPYRRLGIANMLCHMKEPIAVTHMTVTGRLICDSKPGSIRLVTLG